MGKRSAEHSPKHQSLLLEALKLAAFEWIEENGRTFERAKAHPSKRRFRRRGHPSQCSALAKKAGVSTTVITRLLDGQAIRVAQAEKVAAVFSKKLALVD